MAERLVIPGAIIHLGAAASRHCASLADKLHNVRALERDYRAVGDILWERFNPVAGKSGVVGHSRALATAFHQRNEQIRDARVARLAESLEREVAAFEELVGEKGHWPLQK